MDSTNGVMLPAIFHTDRQEPIVTWEVAEANGSLIDTNQVLFFSDNENGERELKFHIKLLTTPDSNDHTAGFYLQNFADIMIIAGNTKYKNSTGQVTVSPAFDDPGVSIHTCFTVTVVLPGEKPTKINHLHSNIEIQLCSKTVNALGLGNVSVDQSRLMYRKSSHLQRSRIGRVHKYFYWDNQNTGNSDFSLEQSFLVDPNVSGYYSINLTPVTTKMDLTGEIKYDYSSFFPNEMNDQVRAQLTIATKHLDKVAELLNNFYARLDTEKSPVSFIQTSINEIPDLTFEYYSLMGNTDAAVLKDNFISIGSMAVDEMNWVHVLAHEFGHMLGLPHQEKGKIKSIMTYDNQQMFLDFDVYLLNLFEAQDVEDERYTDAS
ncbi:matrixin family metalloprotease [Photobacterium sp. Hal280]|uniref:matrixin family metalloprotease n=1 Tax=Photobacterium sp. Hal280 TaxID=3035163 RepID=UPI00301E488F